MATAVGRKLFRVAILQENGSVDYHDWRRTDLLSACREPAERWCRHMPYGEVKARDLRMLESGSGRAPEATIYVRTLCIVVSLHPVHAFLLPGRIILMLPTDTHFLPLLQARIFELLDQNGAPANEHGSLASSLIDRPFHLVAFEAMLHTVVGLLAESCHKCKLLWRNAVSLERPTPGTFYLLQEADRHVDAVSFQLESVRKALNEYFVDDEDVARTSFDSIIASCSIQSPGQDID